MTISSASERAGRWLFAGMLAALLVGARVGRGPLGRRRSRLRRTRTPRADAAASPDAAADVATASDDDSSGSAPSAEKPPLSLDVRVRLSALHFLEFATWGAWWMVLGQYLEAMRYARKTIGNIYATMSLAAIITPLCCLARWPIVIFLPSMCWERCIWPAASYCLCWPASRASDRFIG